MKLEKTITAETINQRLLRIDYAVRGPIVERAAQIERELEKGAKKPFSRVVRANIGDCHALGQPPVTFARQVVALAACPQLMSSPDIPWDVKNRVSAILADCSKGSVGAYSPSNGLKSVRTKVADHLSARDGVQTSFENIFIGSGATDVIRAVMTMLVEPVDGKPPAVMIPCPEYPLFSGTMTELGLKRVDYYLDEDNDWALRVEELERSWREASVDSSVRGMIIINPGNPTGQVLSKENIQEIIKFAYDHDIFLMADEVYQDNIMDASTFHSFRKVMQEMGGPYSSMELSTFMTCSKGWMGECGLRCGFVELLRLDPRVMSAFVTGRSIMQCPSVLGQCLLDCMMTPPVPGEPSYELFEKEKENINNILKDRLTVAYEAFNSIPGYSVNPIRCALFAYPRFNIPARAQQVAREKNMSPDEFYCLRLLEEKGICVVAGTGFGQMPGTYHFRTTVYHPREELDYMVESIKAFHISFVQTYS